MCGLCNYVQWNFHFSIHFHERPISRLYESLKAKLNDNDGLAPNKYALGREAALHDEYNYFDVRKSSYGKIMSGQQNLEHTDRNSLVVNCYIPMLFNGHCLWFLLDT